MQPPFRRHDHINHHNCFTMAILCQGQLKNRVSGTWSCITYVWLWNIVCRPEGVVGDSSYWNIVYCPPCSVQTTATKLYPRQLCSVRRIVIRRIWKLCSVFPAILVIRWLIDQSPAITYLKPMNHLFRLLFTFFFVRNVGKNITSVCIITHLLSRLWLDVQTNFTIITCFRIILFAECLVAIYWLSSVT